MRIIEKNQHRKLLENKFKWISTFYFKKKMNVFEIVHMCGKREKS